MTLDVKALGGARLVALFAIATFVVGCGSGHERTTTPKFGSVEADFVSALLLHDATHAQSLIAPGGQQDDGSVEGMIATLERYRVPSHPIRAVLRHDCTPAVIVVGGGGTTVGAECSTFTIGKRRTGRAVIRVWLTPRKSRVAGFSFRAFPPPS